MKNIQTTLEGVTVENGYVNTLHVVQRLQQDGQRSVHGNGVHIIEGDDIIRDELLAGVDNLLDRQKHVDLVIVARQDTDFDARSASELMNSLEVDVRRAMAIDIWRGGVAVNTKETQANELDIEIGMPELRRVLGYEIRYRHRRLDPTIAG